jgi:protein-tyrosine phosphatase
MPAINVYEHFLKLKNHALLKKIPIEILLGSELYYNERLVQELLDCNAFSMDDTRYILVEFDIDTEFSYMVEGLKNVISLGFLPILAHVERYQWIQKKHNHIENLIELGCYMQMNAQNFITGPFNRNRRYCTKLIKEGKIHFLASDCHDLEKRKPCLGKAIKYLSKKVPDEVLQKILFTNVDKMLHNQII